MTILTTRDNTNVLLRFVYGRPYKQWKSQRTSFGLFRQSIAYIWKHYGPTSKQQQTMRVRKISRLRGKYYLLLHLIPCHWQLLWFLLQWNKTFKNLQCQLCKDNNDVGKLPSWDQLVQCSGHGTDNPHIYIYEHTQITIRGTIQWVGWVLNIS